MRVLCGYVMIGHLADHYDVSYASTCSVCHAYDPRVTLVLQSLMLCGRVTTNFPYLLNTDFHCQ